MSTATLLPPRENFCTRHLGDPGLHSYIKTYLHRFRSRIYLIFFSFYIQRDRVLLILRLLAKSSITADSIK